MLGVQRGWRVAISAAQRRAGLRGGDDGREVDAIDISPAMWRSPNPGERPEIAIRTQSAGLLSFAYQLTPMT